MKFYQYNIYTPESYNATGKAKGDIMKILREEGISDIYNPHSKRIIRILQQFGSISFMHSDCAVIVQYPAVIDMFIRKLKKKSNILLIGIIHDLQSIRGTEKIMDEISILNNFDFIISHNKKMTDFLIKNGCTSKIIDLGIFDYLHDDKKELIASSNLKSICFAGNLDKSEFLYELGEVHNLEINLYGVYNKSKKLPENVIYKGSLPSDEIVYALEGAYGLIWDGDSISNCRGVLGNYLRYNNPHKLSLYISAEKPVIVWHEAAIADFVKKNNLGLTVESLEELEVKINEMTMEDYSRMKKNLSNIKGKLAHVYYTSQSLHSIMTSIKEQEKKCYG